MNEVQRALAPTERMAAKIAEALPSLGLGLLVILVGLAIAMLVRWAGGTLLRRLGLDAIAERVGVARLLYSLRLHGGLSAVLANLFAVMVLLVTTSMAAEIVGLPGVAEGIGTIIGFLPRLVSAGVVALFGFAAAEFASRLAEGMGRRRSDIVAPQFIANLVYYLVLAVVLATSIQHLGMDTDLIDLLLGIGMAAVLGGFALAFAFAGRELLQNVLTRPYVLADLLPGHSIAVGPITGTVLSTGTLTLSIQSEDGTIHVVPYRRLLSGDGFSRHPDP